MSNKRIKFHKKYSHIKGNEMKNLVFIFIVLVVLIMSSCDKEDLFEQPTIEVNHIDSVIK